MHTADVSLLAHALLGLVHQKPSSGYDLRKIFTATPMGSFSDSPGAIYPALRRLEKAGLIRGRVEESAGLRRRQIFRLTAAGSVRLKAWLSQPVTREDVVRGLDAIMLRFAFMDLVLGKAACVRLLRALEQELRAYVAQLRAYLASQKTKMPTSGRLALESGIRGYEAQLRWALYALETYERRIKGGGS